MTKSELIKKIAEDAEVTQKDVKAVLATFGDIVVDTLTNNRDDKITLEKLGTFKVKTVPARSGMISFGKKKGQKWESPEHQEITFKVSSGVKKFD